MKIKYEPEDFRVRELLAEGVVAGRGEHRVYRVTKRKLTSLQAADVLANSAGANTGDVGMCGLKDRQGITTQFMSVRHGKGVSIDDVDLRVETVGFADNELTSEASTGNAFELIVRGLSKEELATLSQNVLAVRRVGLINYFDDQRFGNLRHNQGWIALDLLRGDVEGALKTLLTASSEYENPRSRSFKNKLFHAWGDWAECRDLAGRFGQHHSLFEHLKKNPEDFAGAFFHVASRLRLIHLYAYQSHLWNRAVADFVRAHTRIDQRAVVDTREGPLVYPAGEVNLPVPADATFRLPGPRLEDVTDERQRELLADALAADRLVPAKFAIEGVPGFQLKGEARALFVEPRHLRVRPPERDPLNRPLALVRVRFELPRGAYATLVVRRLLADRLGERAPEPRRETPSDDRGERGPQRERRGGGYVARGDRRGPPRDERPPRRDDRERPFDPERAPRGGERPYREHRGPPRDDRGPRAHDGDRPRREYGGPRRDDRRPARAGGDRPFDPERRPRSDSGERRFDRDRAPRAGERAPREYGAPREGGRAPREYRGPRGGERAPREYGGPRAGERGPREYRGPREGERAPRVHGRPPNDRRGDARAPRTDRPLPPRDRGDRGRGPRRPPYGKKPKHD